MYGRWGWVEAAEGGGEEEKTHSLKCSGNEASCYASAPRFIFAPDSAGHLCRNVAVLDSDGLRSQHSDLREIMARARRGGSEETGKKRKEKKRKAGGGGGTARRLPHARRPRSLHAFRASPTFDSVWKHFLPRRRGETKLAGGWRDGYCYLKKTHTKKHGPSHCLSLPSLLTLSGTLSSEPRSGNQREFPNCHHLRVRSDFAYRGLHRAA